MLMKIQDGKSAERGTGGQVTKESKVQEHGNKILHCQDRKGIAEMRGREGPERRSGMKSDGPETRWIRYIGLGRLAGRMIRMVDWIESWIRKKRQEIIWKQLEVTNQNEWSLEKCIKELRRDARKLTTER